MRIMTIGSYYIAKYYKLEMSTIAYTVDIVRISF